MDLLKKPHSRGRVALILAGTLLLSALVSVSLLWAGHSIARAEDIALEDNGRITVDGAFTDGQDTYLLLTRYLEAEVQTAYRYYREWLGWGLTDVQPGYTKFNLDALNTRSEKSPLEVAVKRDGTQTGVSQEDISFTGMVAGGRYYAHYIIRLRDVTDAKVDFSVFGITRSVGVAHWNDIKAQEVPVSVGSYGQRILTVRSLNDENTLLIMDAPNMADGNLIFPELRLVGNQDRAFPSSVTQFEMEDGSMKSIYRVVDDRENAQNNVKGDTFLLSGYGISYRGLDEAGAVDVFDMEENRTVVPSLSIEIGSYQLVPTALYKKVTQFTTLEMTLSLQSDTAEELPRLYQVKTVSTTDETFVLGREDERTATQIKYLWEENAEECRTVYVESAVLYWEKAQTFTLK